MSVLKLVGSVLVILASTAFGYIVAGVYSRRPAELRLLGAGLELLETQISYALTPLPAALADAATSLRGPAARLFAFVAKRLSGGPGFTAGEAWQMGIDRIWSRMALTARDRDILRALGPHLGVSDRDDQVKHLALTRQRLAAACEEADAAAAKEGKLWRNLGVLAGAALVLVLI